MVKYNKKFYSSTSERGKKLIARGYKEIQGYMVYVNGIKEYATDSMDDAIKYYNGLLDEAQYYELDESSSVFDVKTASIVLLSDVQGVLNRITITY